MAGKMGAALGSHKYSERVEATLGRSRTAEGAVAAAALATATLAWAIPLLPEQQAAALAWTGASALLALRRLRPGLTLSVGREGEVVVGSECGRLREGCFVAPWFTVIRWRPEGAWFDRTLLVAPDMLREEDFRRLRVLLRWR